MYQWMQQTITKGLRVYAWKDAKGDPPTTEQENSYLIIIPYRICTNQSLSWRMRRKKYPGIVRYKQITKSRREDYILHWLIRKENFSSSGLCHLGRILGENKRKRKYKKILRPCLRTKKKPVDQEGDSDNSWSWCSWNGLQSLGRKSGGIGIRGRIETQDDSIVEMLRSANIFRVIQEIWGDLLSRT